METHPTYLLRLMEAIPSKGKVIAKVDACVEGTCDQSTDSDLVNSVACS